MKATTTEHELRVMADAGMSYDEIAERLGRNVGDVANACRVLGIKGADRRRATHDAIAIVDRMSNGETLESIAHSMGQKYLTIYQYMKRSGLPTSRAAAMKFRLQNPTATGST